MPCLLALFIVFTAFASDDEFVHITKPLSTPQEPLRHIEDLEKLGFTVRHGGDFFVSKNGDLKDSYAFSDYSILAQKDDFSFLITKLANGNRYLHYTWYAPFSVEDVTIPRTFWFGKRLSLLKFKDPTGTTHYIDWDALRKDHKKLEKPCQGNKVSVIYIN